MSNRYDDIINLPHHVSRIHLPMPMHKRAAQFAPFAALTGHDSALREIARVTEQQQQLDADSYEMLSRKMARLATMLRQQPTVTVLFFKPDDRKEGGSYHKITGFVKKIREYEQLLDVVTIDGVQSVPFRFIMDITGEKIDDDIVDDIQD